MKTKISKNLVSFPMVRRGNWHVKVSIYKDEQLLLIANHLLLECCVVKVFDNNDDAIEFINLIVEKDYYE
jgi:hypothetical protein